MQGIVTLTRPGITELIEFAFNNGEPSVSQAYSDFDSPLRRFRTANELIADIDFNFANGHKNLSYAANFPDTQGHVIERRISLNPKRCGGHTWRYSVEGWGVFQLQLEQKPDGLVECRIAVNSSKRAAGWADAIPEFETPAQWDWKAVESHAGRLIRRMRKIAKSTT